MRSSLPSFSRSRRTYSSNSSPFRRSTEVEEEDGSELNPCSDAQSYFELAPDGKSFVVEHKGLPKHRTRRLLEVAQAQLAVQASHDALTGLANRRSVDSHLERRSKGNTPFT